MSDRPPRPSALALLLAATTLALAASSAFAFKVVKNVNSPEPPAEKIVLFAKGQTDGIKLTDAADGSKPSFTDDGLIQFQITGFAETIPMVTWAATDARPATFDASAYQYLVIRMKMEGDVKRTLPNGKITASRPDNLWIALCLFDKDGTRCGQVNLASVTEDEKTPAEMTTVKVPMLLLKGPNGDRSKVAGIGFYWPKTHDYNDRQFQLVIERISVAD